MKREVTLDIDSPGGSLPTRERELKPRLLGGKVTKAMSLPTRERELKHPREPGRPLRHVAPYTGA